MSSAPASLASPVTCEPPLAFSMGALQGNPLQPLPPQVPAATGPTLLGRDRASRHYSSPSPMTRMVNSFAKLLSRGPGELPQGSVPIAPSAGVGPRSPSAPPQGELIEGLGSTRTPNLNPAAAAPGEDPKQVQQLLGSTCRMCGGCPAAMPVQGSAAACGTGMMQRTVPFSGGSLCVPSVQRHTVPSTVRSGQPQQPPSPQAVMRGLSPLPSGQAGFAPPAHGRGRSPPPREQPASSATLSPRPMGRPQPPLPPWALSSSFASQPAARQMPGR